MLADEPFGILDAVGKGHSLVEIIRHFSEEQLRPARLEWRDPRWFRFDRRDLTTARMLDDDGQSALGADQGLHERHGSRWTSDLYRAGCDRRDRQISKAVPDQTGTTDAIAGGGRGQPHPSGGPEGYRARRG